MKKLVAHYGDDADVAFLAVQTVFEGYGANSFEKGKGVMKKYGLEIPMGQDGAPGKRPGIMRDYRTRGTPWTIVIGPDGIVRYSAFHIESAAAIRLIDGLKSGG